MREREESEAAAAPEVDVEKIGEEGVIGKCGYQDIELQERTETTGDKVDTTQSPAEGAVEHIKIEV